MNRTPSFQTFLEDLIAHGGERLLKIGAENLPGIQTLIKEGYIRLARARVGPLGIVSGDYFVVITDAGRKAIEPTATRLNSDQDP
jgi:hypothetical protein